MSAWHILNAANVKQLEIERGKSRIAEACARLLPPGISYDRDKVQTSPTDQMAAGVAEIVDLEEELDRLRAQKALQVQEIDRLINMLDDEFEKTILVGYFIEGESIENMAERINYSRSGAYYIFNRGLANVEEILGSSRK